MWSRLVGILAGSAVGFLVLAGQASAYCWQTGDPTGPIFNASCGETKCSNTGPNGNAKGTAYYDYAQFCAEYGDPTDLKKCTRWDDGCYYHTFECNEPCEGADYDGGGGSCPGECRQGSSCGVGYSGASGCSGQGPGGGCKTNQVCCAANSCGGGGGGGTVQCVQPQDCPPGTVKSATVKSAVCQPVCGNNAWGTGGSPGTAQSYTGCCQWETTGGGNCVWEPCPTKSNPGKVCKVCDPEETWCKRETVTTYECIPSCVTQKPSSVTLSSPTNGARVGGTGVTLDWNAVTSWGVAL